jgi:hypothetical protein
MPRFESPLSTVSQSSRWSDMSVLCALLPMSFWIPRKEPPWQSSRKERCSLSGALQITLKIPSQRTLRFPDGSLRLWRPSPEMSATLFLKVPGKWAPLRVSQQGSHEERNFFSRANGLFFLSFTYLYLSEYPMRSPPTERAKHLSTKHIPYTW